MADSEVLFTNVKIIDGSGAAPYNGEVLVRGKRISRVARSARSFAGGGGTVIDGAGATLMPGMVEAHTHFAWNNAVRACRHSEDAGRGAHAVDRARREGVSRPRLDIVRRRSDREAAARCRRAQRDQLGIDSGSALSGSEPGDHRARRARRRNTAASAVPRIQLRGQRQRAGRHATRVPDVPAVRRRLDQAQSVGRQPGAARERKDDVDDRRRSEGRRRRSDAARQAGRRACAQRGLGQAGGAARLRSDLSRELHRQRSARSARSEQAQDLRRTRAVGDLQAAAGRHAVRNHAREGARDGLRRRARRGDRVDESDAQARHSRAARRRLRIRMGAARHERHRPAVLRQALRHDADGSVALRDALRRTDHADGQRARRSEGRLSRRSAAGRRRSARGSFDPARQDALARDHEGRRVSQGARRFAASRSIALAVRSRAASSPAAA